MFKNPVLYIVSLLILSSCISRPDYVLDEEKMVELLTDVHRSEGLFELQSSNGQGANEEYKKSVMSAVLVKNNVTRAQYDSSLVWYGQNLKYLVKVYNKVQKNISDEIDYWENIKLEDLNEFGMSVAGDSVQLWNIDNYQLFDEEKFCSFRFWEIKSDSNYIAGDSIVWHIHVPFIPDGHFLVASLSLNYSEDESVRQISNNVVIRNDSSFVISCASDTAKIFDSMYASISLLKDSINTQDSHAFVDSLSLIRIHK